MQESEGNGRLALQLLVLKCDEIDGLGQGDAAGYTDEFTQTQN